MEGSKATRCVALHEVVAIAQVVRDPPPPPQNGGDQVIESTLLQQYLIPHLTSIGSTP